MKEEESYCDPFLVELGYSLVKPLVDKSRTIRVYYNCPHEGLLVEVVEGRG